VNERPERPQGPFTVWQDGGYDGWSFEDYPTLKDALEAHKYNVTWVIQKSVAYEVNEASP
jgi:hypothetical protein